MAGGPNAALWVCGSCAGKAVRTSEGAENDWYRCEGCGATFGIDWSRGQPAHGYVETPSGLQWTGRPRRAVDKSDWQPCANCGRSIPVNRDMKPRGEHYLESAGTLTYSCPFCHYGQVGTPHYDSFVQRQSTCLDCKTPLAGGQVCPQCRLPKGWVRIDCPNCRFRHPVCAPHWTRPCDMFRLECVSCETVFESLCIC